MNLDYIAGFFDGEGSIGLKLTKEKSTMGFGLRPRLSFTQKNRQILEEIHKTLGIGSVVRRNHMGISDSYVHVLDINNFQECRKFLALLGSRVVLKHKQVAILAQFFKIHSYYRRPTPELAQQEFQLFMQLREMNGQYKRLHIPTSYVKSCLRKYIRDVNSKRRAEKQLLVKLYWKDQMSQERIAKQLKLSRNTVMDRMIRHGIPARPRLIRIEKALLEDLYWKKHMSLQQIAEHLNISRDTVWDKMRRYQIPRRPNALTIKLAMRAHIAQSSNACATASAISD